MSAGETNDRVVVTTSGRTLGVSIQIGDVVVTVAAPVPRDVMCQSEDVVRN